MDADPDFLFQGLLLIASLVHNAGVTPENIHAHVTDNVDRNLHHALAALGINVHVVEPFHPQSPHCNKISQLKTDAWRSYDTVVFCDCDIAVTRDFVKEIGEHDVSGKVVDYANPPLAIIEGVFRAAELGFGEVTQETSFRSEAGRAVLQIPGNDEAGEHTHAANLNGGLYILRSALIPAIAESWSKWALWLIDTPDLMGSYSVHVDQLSFSLAMAELDLTPNLLPVEHNFPTHIAVHPSAAAALSELSVLHYHRALDEVGLPKPGELPQVNEAVGKIGHAWSRFADFLQTHADPHVRLLLKRRERWLHWRNVVEKRDLPLPDHMDMEKPIVAIETLGECNYKCAYCPVSVTPKRNGRMSRETFEKVLQDLVDFDGAIQLRLHFYNEPLLDKRLHDFIRLSKEKLPNTYIRVVTNGNLLTEELAERLFSAGLDHLAVSGHKKEDVDRIVRTFRGSRFEALIETRNAYERSTWSDRRASVELEKNDLTRQLPAGVKPWGCSFLTAQIDYLGQVHQCCEDYQGDLVLGDVARSSVSDILESHRDRLKQVFCGRFDATCAHCAGFDEENDSLVERIAGHC